MTNRKMLGFGDLGLWPTERRLPLNPTYRYTEIHYLARKLSGRQDWKKKVFNYKTVKTFDGIGHFVSEELGEDLTASQKRTAQGDGSQLFKRTYINLAQLPRKPRNTPF